MHRRILTLFLAVTSAAVLRAQGGGMGGGQFQPPPDHWLTMDSLAQAVGLTADQRGKVAPHYAELNAAVKKAADRRAAFRASMGGSMAQMTPEQRQAMRPKMDSVRTEMDALQQEADTHYGAIRALLTPEQQAKFDALPKPRVAMRRPGAPGQ
ncbi:MAG: hypothetical protein DMD37_00630 [Gemmatimonadetes bacterium]|nr:MAG: hypothetical protein DMD74_07640 [Gemmatimonadota bacterium]PYO65103.1 MAG: hypothetical protein DMD71_11155 [Gemmatimonadota bacterium]PYO86003.1 MAG: hypothetical protein DMD68_01795 [Gemmatimonadota bacterium]PYP64967.1 MAG: hypothetical protein DMD37_00630 [Gemmatimonadota bacterium]